MLKAPSTIIMPQVLSSITFQVLEGKNLLLAEEIAAIRANFENLYSNEAKNTKAREDLPYVDSVPEELFRRF